MDAPTSVVAAAPHPFKSSCADAGCPACLSRREKKREENRKHRSKGNPFARDTQPSPVARPALSIVPSGASGDGPAVASKPFVPWTVDIVRPLVSQGANLLEKWDGESLILEARKVSPRVEEFVKARVAWNAEAKGMLVDGGAECAVKYLNAAGISAEYLPEIKFGLAALAILNARVSLVSELRKMAEEDKKAKVTDQAEKKAA